MGFREWYIRYQSEITWFLIGWLCFAGIDNILNSQYFWAVINFALAYANYKLDRIRMEL